VLRAPLVLHIWATRLLFLVFFLIFFVSVPCARLSWPARQLLSAYKFTVPYGIVSCSLATYNTLYIRNMHPQPKRNISLLWPSTWPITLTHELDLDGVQLNQRVTNLDQRSSGSKVIIETYSQEYRHIHPTYCFMYLLRVTRTGWYLDMRYL